VIDSDELEYKLCSLRILIEGSEFKKPRVLVKVSGGVAYYVADEGVEVVIFDNDDFQSDPIGTHMPPANFADLAELIDAPVSL
jgi:hypothetical protein